MPTLEDDDLLARLSQVRGRREAVVASSDHNGVIRSRHDADLTEGASRRQHSAGAAGRAG